MNMRTAVIKGGSVVNVIVADSDFTIPDALLIKSETAQIGDAYNATTKKFTSPVAPAPTLTELRPAYEAAVQVHLDSVARQHGYDNVHTACAYAGAPNPFQAESQQFIAWRGAVWVAAFALFQQVEAGTVPLPTPEDAIASLPAFPLET